MDSDTELNDKTKSVMYFVRGASFDKKEFKRKLAGSVSYPPVYTVVPKVSFSWRITIIIGLSIPHNVSMDTPIFPLLLLPLY
jgi:hypothetical protein